MNKAKGKGPGSWSPQREQRAFDRPAAGFSSAPWMEVAAFYAQWGGFATVKDFSWADQYNPASAPNRRVGAGGGRGGMVRASLG